MTGPYCVVLADVEGSQDIADREAFEMRLNAAIDAVNGAHREALHAPFDTIKGVDEFGGVLETVAPVADVQRAFSRRLHPERFRMAAVVGEVDVNAEADEISRMDGPAFARADEQLAALEDGGRRFAFDGTRPYVDQFVADEINLLEVIRGEWGETTAAVIEAAERCDSQADVAAALDVSEQTVSYHLRKPTVAPVLAIEDNLSSLLARYGDGRP